MSDMDAITLADHAVMIGLVSAGQAREAVSDAEDGSLAALSRSMLRKGLLTSWQLDRLQKNDPTGFFFGGCKVLFHLAEGTFARVYRGERQDSRSPVAVKVLRNRFVIDPAAVQRFNKEAESGMKLAHPNIVRILSHGEEDKRHYMIMEYVEGSNLRDFLKIRGRMSQKDAMPLIVGLSRGLKYSIDNGVTHRDIKGTNILVSTNGEAKLVDFGLAGIEGDEKKTTIQSQRTVDYSALERTCKSEKGDPRSDIFFLGCVFYQMLTGKVAMAETESKDMLAKMLKRSFGAIQPLSESPYAPDPEICRIIEKMMKVELRSRYQSMTQVVEDLDAFESRGKAGAGKGSRSGSSGEHDFMADIEQMFMNRYADVATEPEPAPEPALASVSAVPASPEPEAASAAPADDDDDQVIGTVDEDEAPIHAGQQVETRALVRRKVLCVESQGDVQEVLKKSLSKLGYRVILVGDAERAAERFRESPPDAVVFDVDGLGAGAIDSFIDMHDKAREDGQDLAALILMGPRHLAFKNRLPSNDRLIVLAKPVKMKQIQDALARLIPVV